MQGQWLQVVGHYLFSTNRKRVDLVTDIHQKLYMWEVYKCHLEMVIYHLVVLITPIKVQNQVFILDYMMTMTLCLKLGMAEEDWTLHL